MMAEDPTRLPDDPALLKQLVCKLEQQLQDAKREQQRLLHQLREQLRARFGRRSERMADGQLALFLEEAETTGQVALEPSPEAEQAAAEKPPRRTPHGRRRLPKDLPRQRIEHAVPEADRVCVGCHTAMTKIGEETSELLEYQPAHWLVLEHVRPKYACRTCQDGVVTAAKPPQPIEKGLAGPGLLAHVVVSKYADHLPLYRQSQIFRRSDIDLHRSTLGGWIAETAALLEPLVRRMAARVLQSDKIHTDDVPVPVLDPSRTSTREGRLWVYVGDAAHPFTVYDFSPNHQQRWPLAFLAGYEGYLQADAYPGYDTLYKDGRIVEVACWAHARRKYYDARESDFLRAHVMLAYIKLLYDIEREARELPPDERHALRLGRSPPLLAGIDDWLTEQEPRVLPKSPIGEAMTYTRNQWDALNRFLDDGRLEIDNNIAENAVRAVVLGRKNYLFAGSDAGGRRAAIHYSLIQTCKAHDVEPFAYLRDVLARIPTHPAKRIDELLPPNWQPAPVSPTLVATS